MNAEAIELWTEILKERRETVRILQARHDGLPKRATRMRLDMASSIRTHQKGVASVERMLQGNGVDTRNI